ncbi:MAG: type II toxin-antitoxin system ParD family antitoxin [Phycisphaerales bacterium]
MADRQTTMNISLPTSLKRFLREEMERGGFGNTSEYVRHLLREARRAAFDRRLEELLKEGYESGSPVELTKSEWASIRAEARARVQRRKSA